MRKLFATIAASCLFAMLSACGGGGGGSGTTTGTAAPSTSTPPATSSTTPSSGQSTSQPVSSPGTSTTPVANQMTVTVGPNPYSAQNILYASVTICVPGTSNCQTINNVQVDTGSYGLRLMASAVTLPLQKTAATAGGTLAECTTFGSGTAWGTVATAEVKLAGEVASGAPIQLIADPAVSSSEANNCRKSGVTQLDSPSAIGANGILGIGLETADCGATCASSTGPAIYFGCAANATSCSATTVPVGSQVTNPVSMFAKDNNGAMLTLPSVPTTGSSSASGTLTFGIDTQTDNALGAAKVYTLNANDNLTTIFNSTTLSESFLDSGSNGLFFDYSLPLCSSGLWYCPPSTTPLSAVMQGLNGSNVALDFNVGNAGTLVGGGAYAMNDSAGPSGLPDMFDWGLPAFYGRRIYTAIDGKSNSGGTGPFFAF